MLAIEMVAIIHAFDRKQIAQMDKWSLANCLNNYQEHGARRKRNVSPACFPCTHPLPFSPTSCGSQRSGCPLIALTDVIFCMAEQKKTNSGSGGVRETRDSLTWH